MGGRPLKRARELEASMLRGEFPIETAEVRSKIAAELAGCIDRIIETSKDRTHADFFRSNVYIVERVLGSIRPETNAVTERLQAAQAALVEAQVEAQLPIAQRRELDARSAHGEMMTSMFPKQFVEEKDQMEQMQKLAAAVNRPLMMMTVQEFAAIAPGVEDASEALQTLKGKLGRDQAEIAKEIFGGEEE